MTNAKTHADDAHILESLFAQGPVVIFKWINVENWPVEYVTANVEKIFGHSAHAFMNSVVGYATLIHPDDLKRVAAEVAKASAAGINNFRHVPYRILRPDGEERWIEDHTLIVRDDEGIITHFHGYVTDITEHRDLKQASHDSEARYRTILSTTQQGYWLVDDNGITVEVNPAMCRMLGYDAEDMIGKSPFKFLTDDSAAELKNQFKLRMAGDQRTYELDLIAKDGLLRHTLANATTLPDSITSARSFALVTDITTFTKDQRTLSTLWQALERTPISIIITDLEGAIEYANPFFETMTGYTQTEIIGQNPRILNAGRTDPSVYKDLWSTITDGRVWRGNVVNAHKSGNLYWAHQTITPTTDAQGNITHFVAFTEDVSTAHKAMDAQIQATEDAELAGQAKSMLLANMGHELRTPLNAIIEFADIMHEQLRGALPEVYKDYARLIHNSGTHLLDIINDILKMSQVEMDGVELTEEEFSLDALLFECISFLHNMAHYDQVSIVNHASPTSRLRADRLRIKQILLNLLSNAIKFSPDSTIIINTERRLGHFSITITDQGRGMSPQDIAIAIKPFGHPKSDAHRRGEGAGYGLGLPVSKRLIEAHGGHLEIDSTLGEGTTVSIIFPDSLVLADAD